MRLIDIARTVGVSSRVVSKVLFPNGANSAQVSQKTAEKVRAVAQELGYLPNLTAKQLAGESTRMIGVLVQSFVADVSYKVLAQLETYASLHGYRLVIGQVHDDESLVERFIADFAGRRMEGVVCFVHEVFGASEAFRRLCEPISNMVFIGPPKIDWGDWVSADLAEGIRLIVQHLHESGRRRIALVQPQSDMAPYLERIRGFSSILQTLRLPPEQCPVWTFTPRADVKAVFRETLEELLVQHPEIDAIVAPNDVSAMYVMQYLHRRGIGVPEKIAVTGFDNSVVADAAIPPITSLDQQSKELAQRVIDTLLSRIKDPQRSRQALLIPPQLCVRGSSLCTEESVAM